jgi:methyl-accepting chemotaxis protein
MFRDIPLAHKITSLPALACLSFVLLLATAWFNAQGSKRTLTEIESGYYSSLEYGYALYRDLGEVHRSFQDAAATADLETLDEAVVHRDNFLNNLNSRRRIPVVDPERLDNLEEQFTTYFELAHSTTYKLIEGTGGDEVFDELQIVATQVFSLQDVLDKMTESDKSAVASAFASALSGHERSNQVMLVVAAVSALLLVVTSTLIIRATLDAMRSAVHGMRALAKGDLSQETSHKGNDEIGQMVSSVGDVTGTVNELAKEVTSLIDAVRAGRISVRGEPHRFQGAYAQLIENINELIDEFVDPIETTADFVERISRGDIPPAITEEYEGDFNKTKNNLNVMAGTLNSLVKQVAGVTVAARDGRLSKRGDASDFSGVWGELIGGVNETFEAVALPIQEVSHVLSNIANGNLTTTIKSNYGGDFAKLRDDVNGTVTKLTDVISNIKGSSVSVARAANELAENNQTLRTRTEVHANNLKETASSMNAMTQTVQQNADNAREANDLVIQAREKARQGGEAVNTVVSAMEGINDASGKIGDIISVIDEIAFQTNLLALNAAVEAARAGEQGRGFAVVANEVRVLAGRTGTAAKEIAELIQNSVTKVDEGSRLVDESGQTLKEIISAVSNVTEVVSAIAEASSEQTERIQNVDDAIGRMTNMTQENAAAVEQATETTLSMGGEARQLDDMIDFFHVGASTGSVEIKKLKRVAS